MKYTLNIGWLYPELMSTYGDRGNIICISKRCEWRDIFVNVNQLNIGFTIDDLHSCDFIFMGGAQDRQQKIVSIDLNKDKTKALKYMVDNEIPGLYICGAYQFLGRYYKEADGTIIDGLNILDLYTENPGENHERLIGNIAVVSNVILNEAKNFTHRTSGKRSFDLRLSNLSALSRFGLSSRSNDSKPKGRRAGHSAPLAQDDNDHVIVGFENHGGRTYLGKNVKPLGTVIKGFGNNGTDKTEGAVYKNSFGSYLHGPILPKNPNFADHLIKLALEKKYKKSIELSPLDDSLECRAHQAIANRLGLKI